MHINPAFFFFGAATWCLTTIWRLLDVLAVKPLQMKRAHGARVQFNVALD